MNVKFCQFYSAPHKSKINIIHRVRDYTLNASRYICMYSMATGMFERVMIINSLVIFVNYLDLSFLT